jgi:uncharacterized protein involved in outer membrane biogenesis
MKRFLIGFFTVFVLLLAALVALPILFKDDIVRLVKEEVNRRLDARVDFGDFSLSLFRQFPDFSFMIEDVRVVGIREFEGDTLVSVGKLDLTVDLMSVIGRESLLVREVRIERLDVLAKVHENGRANWDIVRRREEKEPASEEPGPKAGAAPYRVSLRELQVSHFDLVYDNAREGTRADVEELNLSLRGDFTKETTVLETHATLSAVTLEKGGIPYLNRTEVEYWADLDADLANSKFTFRESELRLNRLTLEGSGTVAKPGEHLELNVKFRGKETDVKNILSLIPAIYGREFETIETSGSVTVDGYIGGRYSEEKFPSFAVRLFVEDGSFRYPDLPESADHIHVDMNLTNPGGTFDYTLINISKLHVEIAENPVDIQLVIRKPISDPDIHCLMKGRLDLSRLGRVIPMKSGEEMSGVITSDITLRGKVSAIEQKKYDQFQAVGGLSVLGMTYKSPDFPRGIVVERADMRFSPQYVDLTEFQCRVGRSDLRARGKVENVIPYAMTDDAVLVGRGELSSRFLDLDEIMTDREAQKAGVPEKTTPSPAIEVPENIDFRIVSTFDKVEYDEVTMTDVRGVLRIQDRVLTMENLGMDLLGGKTTMNGRYSTRDTKQPAVDLDLTISSWDIPLAYRAFQTVQALAPIAERTSGLFSSRVKFSGTLGPGMTPILSSLTGSGDVQTKKAVIENSQTINKVADLLKNDRFKRMEFRDIDLPFQFREGRVHVEPFRTVVGSSKLMVSGSHGFDQTLDYTMKFEIPASVFGGNLSAFLGGVSSQLSRAGLNIDMGKMAEAVQVDLLVRGTVPKPTVTIGGVNLIGSGGKALKEQLTEKARQEAEKILLEAERRAQAIREEARKAADTVRKEGYARADQLEKQGGENPVARAASKAAADKARKETDKKAENIIAEADRRAEQLLEEARKKAGGTGP